MAIHIKRNVNTDIKSGVFSSSVHYMPCQIHLDGKANVTKYFVPYISKKDNENEDVLGVSFRGYPLIGKTISLPVGYRCIVAQEIFQPLSEEAERNVHVTHTFKSFTYWNWDKIPTKNDALLSALDWIDISNALHSPIDGSS